MDTGATMAGEAFAPGFGPTKEAVFVDEWTVATLRLADNNAFFEDSIGIGDQGN